MFKLKDNLDYIQHRRCWTKSSNNYQRRDCGYWNL